MTQVRQPGSPRNGRGQSAASSRRRSQTNQPSQPNPTKPPRTTAPITTPKSTTAPKASAPTTQPLAPLCAKPTWRRPTRAELRARLRTWDTPWSRFALRASGIWLATRLIYLLLTYIAVAFSEVNKTTSVAGLLLQHWNRLDTVWYVNIARFGYWAPTAATFARDNGQMPTAFFPLYPMLINATSHLIGDTQGTFSALLVGNLGTLLAFIGMAFFAANEDGIASGARALRLAAAYPLAFFLTAGYTDGLFFGLAVFALFFARRRQWYAVVPCALLAALTRITALALILPLAWEYGNQHGWWTALASLARRIRPPRTLSPTATTPHSRTSSPQAPANTLTPQPWPTTLQTLALGLLVIAAVPLGLGIYMLYLGATFNDPLSFVHAAQNGWLHVAMAPWESIPLGLHLFFAQPPFSYAQAQIFLDLGAVFVFTILTIVAARRMPVAFTLYMAGLISLAIASPTIFPGNADIFFSAGRYLIPSAPIFLILSRWTAKRPALESLLVDGGFLLQAALVTLWLAISAYIV